MIQVIVGNNVNRETKLVPATTTLRAVLEEAGIDYSRGTTHLDGATLKAGEISKTFAELGYTGEEGKDKCFLLNVVKADNA